MPWPPLGAEEGLKNVLQGVGVHAMAVVRYGQFDILSGPSSHMALAIEFVQYSVSGLDKEGASFGHGVLGVHSKIHYYLLYLYRICVDRLHILRQPQFNVDHLFNGVLEQLLGLFHLMI